jgi:hypothetical protein
MDIFDTIFVDGATNIFGTVFEYTVVDVPYLSLDFTGNNAATGSLTAISATATLTAYTATGTLVVIEVEQ